MFIKPVFVAFLCLLFLTSCATKPIQPEPVKLPIQPQTPPNVKKRIPGPLPVSTRPTYNLSGYPPATRQGYIDGCETAKQSKYGFKDLKRYKADGQYQMGWNDGFALCGGK